ncbi:MAG TPA: invasin domain 3-containing protein [Balneolaceae bacterium]|nr:invasin domain 3-containing protein [Balneolaceae bacterium]
MKQLLIIFGTVIFLFSCDSTNTSFDKAIPETYVLQINSNPTDGGTVKPVSGQFLSGSKIEIQAFPNEGWVFDGWEGDLESKKNPDSLLVDGDKNINARFVRNDFSLDIQVEGQGRVTTEEIQSKSLNTGSKIASPATTSTEEELVKIPKQKFSGDNNTKEEKATSSYSSAPVQAPKQSQIKTLKLTAEPAEGWAFKQWKGDLTGSENPTTVVIDTNKSITAVFEEITPSALIITRQPGVSIAGTSISGPPTARVTNNQGAPINGIEVKVSEQGNYTFDEGTLTVTTGSDGQASFNDLVINTAGSYKLIFKVMGMTGEVLSNTFTVNPASGDPTRTTATVPNGIAGDLTKITILVADAYGNPVSGVAGNLSANITSGANVRSKFSKITDDGNGVYRTSYSPKNSGTDRIDIELNGKDISGSPFTSTVTTNSAAKVIINVQPKTSEAGNPIQGPPTILVTDAQNNPVKGIEVTVSDEHNYTFNKGTLTTVTEGSGLAVFDDLVINTQGQYRLVFDAAGISDNIISNTFTVNPAAANPGQTTASVPNGAAGEPTAINIIVTDAFGNRISGVAGKLSVNVFSGPNAGTAFTSISDQGNGVYQTSYTPRNSGTDKITIQLEGQNISGSPFSSIVSASATSAFIFSTINSPQTAGSGFGITITARDARGNTATGYNGTANLSTGAGSISPASVSFTNGIATPTVTVTKAGSGQTITATDGGITGTSNNFNVNSGPISVSASSVTATSPHTANGTDAATVTIKLNDTYGNPVSGLSASAFTLSLTGNAIAGSVIETSTAGIYRTNITDNTAEKVSLTVTANGTKLENNPIITFVAGPPASLVITQQPTNTTAGQMITPTPQVQVRDANNNPVSGAGIAVTLNTGNFADGSVTSVNTDAAGIATFDKLIIESAQSGYKLNFKINTISIYSDNFAVTSGPISASASGVTATSPHTANGTDASTVTIRLTDAYGNVISGLSDSNFNLQITGEAKAKPINETSSGTYQTGITDDRAQSVTLTVTVNGVTLNETATITFVAGPPSSLKIIQQPTSTTAGQAISPSPSVLVTDAKGNPVVGTPVNVSLNTNSFSPGSITTNNTDETGTAIFNNLIIEKAQKDYILNFSHNPLTASSGKFEIKNAEAAQLLIVSGDGQTGIVGANLNNPFVVGILDAYGNAVNRQAVDFTISQIPDGATGQSLSKTSVSSDPNGQASTVLKLGNIAGTYRVEATTGGVSNSITFSAVAEPGPADSFSFSEINSPQMAGSGFGITIIARDANGNTATGYSGTASLSTTAGTISPTNVSFVNGVATSTVSVTKAGSNQIISASDGAIDGSSNNFEVTSGPVDISTSSVTATSPHLSNGTDASTVTIKLSDAYENPVSGLTNINFSLQLTGNAIHGPVIESTTPGTYETSITDDTAENVTVTVTVNGKTLIKKPTIIFGENKL